MKTFLGTFQTILSKIFFEVKAFAEMRLSANLFPLESSIQKHAGFRGAAQAGGARGRIPRPWKK